MGTVALRGRRGCVVAAGMVALSGAPALGVCLGDADGSGHVSFVDVTSVLVNFGTNYGGGTGLGDADGNGQVNFADITSVLVNFGSNCVPPPGVVLSEFRAIEGIGAPEFIELYNPGAAPIDLRGMRITNSGGAAQTVRAASDLTGANLTPVLLGAGAYAWGVATPASPAGLPPGAAFTFGAPGVAWSIGDTGDVLSVATSGGAPLDSVDFLTPLPGPTPAFQTDANQPVLPGQFPGFAGRSTQLSPDALTTALNNSGGNWCVSFHVAATPGAANRSCSEVVVNEVLADFAAPGGDDEDEGRTFIELAGPGGGRIAGVTVEISGVTVATIGGGSRLATDGLFVIADLDAMASSFVPNADAFGDDVNPPDQQPGGTWVVVRAQGGAELDRLGFGPGAPAEGIPVPEIDPFDLSISYARNESSADTGNNAADFHYDPTPTPGAVNGPVVPTIIEALPTDALASVSDFVAMRVIDVANFETIDGVAPFDNDADGSFAGNVTDDTDAPGEGLLFVEALDDGRGEATVLVQAPDNGGVVARGPLQVINPGALGGGVAEYGTPWTYTGVQNETGAPLEADSVTLVSPASFTTSAGATSPLITGRILENGVTNAAGPSAQVTAQVGFALIGLDPTASGSWLWFPATWSAQVGSSDQYTATVVAPTPFLFNQFWYTFRFSLDGGLTWTYADLDGAGSSGSLTFDVFSLGTMTVN